MTLNDPNDIGIMFYTMNTAQIVLGPKFKEVFLAGHGLWVEALLGNQELSQFFLNDNNMT